MKQSNRDKKVLVLSTSRYTRGGITAVLKLYEQSEMWQRYHCRWIGTHRDGNNVRKMLYYLRAVVQYVFLLPFFDIVHFHISLPRTVQRKYPLFKLAKILGKKTIIHLHCGSQIDNIWSQKYQTMFEQCDCGILLSENLKQKIEEHIGKSDKFQVVYNPCAIIADTANYEKQNCILFSGTLYEGKGYRDLIRAFAKIATKYPEWKIVLAGNGEVEQARNLANELEVPGQVELLGWVKGEAKHKAFCEAKALCLPSYAEGFPMAVLDAWAYGLPVITTPVGGVPDVAVDGENMLLFNPGDIEKLAHQLERIIVSDELREHLSKKSYEMSKGLFSLKAVTTKIARIYDKLIKV